MMKDNVDSEELDLIIQKKQKLLILKTENLFEHHKRMKEVQSSIAIGQIKSSMRNIKPEVCYKQTGCAHKWVIPVNDNKYKDGWDAFIGIVLVITCVMTPINIAFSFDKSFTHSEIADHTIDFLFLIDIIICFNAEFIADNHEVIRDRKRISINYLTGWFFIDIVSIIPFSEFFSGSKYNKLARISRVGKLQKLIKLGKLFRVCKLLKNKDSLVILFKRLFDVGPGIERLVIFLFTFFFMCHICTCFWITIASLGDDPISENFKGTWLAKYYPDYNAKLDLYMISLYWTITTITTVGYGDISGTNMVEMIFCCFVMIIGVIAYGFANGTLASIMTNYDNKSEHYQDKLDILNKAHDIYDLDHDLYKNIKMSIELEDDENEYEDLNKFVRELPYTLRCEVSHEIFK